MVLAVAVYLLVHRRTNMQPKSIAKGVPEKSRGDLLAEIARLPRSAFILPAQAAAYIGSNPAVLQNWRSQRRGPRYHGKDEFVRYRISDLDAFMSTRAHEVRPDELSTGPIQPTSGQGIAS
jgi:hypothetical protein